MLSVQQQQQFVDESTAPASGPARGDVEALRAALTDGCILCEVANAVKPGTIKRYNKRRNGAPIKMKFKQLKTCRSLLRHVALILSSPTSAFLDHPTSTKLRHGRRPVMFAGVGADGPSPAQVEASKPKNLVEEDTTRTKVLLHGRILEIGRSHCAPGAHAYTTAGKSAWTAKSALGKTGSGRGMAWCQGDARGPGVIWHLEGGRGLDHASRP